MSLVVIGAGHGGGAAAVELRRAGFVKPITLVGEEAILPYQRPQLSKAWLTGETTHERLSLRSQEARVAIIGGGYVGLETAASARKLGAQVYIIERESRALARVTCPLLSEFFMRVHKELWITFHHVQPVPIILSLTQLKEMDSKKGRHRRSTSAETQAFPGVINLSTSRQAIRAFRLWKPIADTIKHAPKVGTIPISNKMKQLLDRANKARRHW